MARQERPELLAVAIAFLLLGGLITVYSTYRVQQGRWQHVDASIPHERRDLHHFILPLLVISSLLTGWLLHLPVVALGIATAGLIVLIAKLCLRWFKLSHHVAFATFAAILQWPFLPGVLLIAFAVFLIGWSRIVLHRHQPIEVCAGTLAGIMAGSMFWLSLFACRQFDWL